MNKPTNSSSDVAGRLLALAIWLLPAHRREWGRAMQAELDHLDESAARRRFALGCLRVAFGRRATFRAILLVALSLTVLGVALVWASGIADPGVRAEAMVLVLILALCSGLGLGIGWFGPVAEGRSAHWVRGVGYATVGTIALFFIGSNRFPLGEPHADPAGWWIAALAVTSYLVTTMVTTARISPMHVAALTRSSVVGCGVASAWWIAMLFIPAVREQHVWGVLSVPAAMLAAGVLAARRPDSAAQGLFGALLSGTVSCMLIFIAAVGTYAIVPGLVPDVAGHLGDGLTAADRVSTNRIESTDPYIVQLLLGALLGTALCVVLIRIMVGAGGTGQRPRRAGRSRPRSPIAHSPNS